MKLSWVSDIHLNFLGRNSRLEFYQSIWEADGDAVVISGDIAESQDLNYLLREMKFELNMPVYFVLGNHDFYKAKSTTVKKSVKKLGYLGHELFVPLNDTTAMVGVDGWGDCRYGDFENSRLTMADWIYIEDLKPHYLKGMSALKKRLQRLADADAKKLEEKVREVIFRGFTKIIIVSHVPPFEEVCLYNGRKSTPSGLPFFASKCLGDAILPIAKQNPKLDFLWLSGHTHSRAKFKPCNNLTVKVAKAEYYYPTIEQIFEF